MKALILISILFTIACGAIKGLGELSGVCADARGQAAPCEVSK